MENINNGDITAITGSGSFSDGPDSGGVTSGNSGDYTDATGNGVMYDQNYSANTLYYNPTVKYEPWVNSTGIRLTGGTSYADVYSDTNFVDYTGVENSTSSGQSNSTGVTRTFYAPKAEGGNTTYLSNVGNYDPFPTPRRHHHADHAGRAGASRGQHRQSERQSQFGHAHQWHRGKQQHGIRCDG